MSHMDDPELDPLTAHDIAWGRQRRERAEAEAPRVRPNGPNGHALLSRALSWSQLRELSDPFYVVKGLIDRGSLVEIYGPHGSGKSFFWRSDETAANPDSEILAALRPAMATIPGAMLLAASSPYARRGELWQAFRRHHGRDDSPALCWQAATRTMDPTVPQSVVDEALEEDPAKAAAEYLAEFRSDIESFVAREVVEALIAPSRFELPPMRGVRYHAFCDPSGGSADSMTLAIGHLATDNTRAPGPGRAVLDAVREVRPPFSPESVVIDFALLLKSYNVRELSATDSPENGPASASASTASATTRPRNPRTTSTATCCRC
jgi:hypothetical protein